MKRKTLVFGTLLWTIAVFSQNVSIPDTAFYNALITIGVDTNNDSLISYEEAEAITNLNVNGDWFSGNIIDMTGIEAFINLNRLDCSRNQIINLDVSNFSTLRYLYMYENQLTELDVSNFLELVTVDCHNNQLTNLNVTNCPELMMLYCDNNQLKSLDLSTNYGLVEMSCSGNLLTSLDISQNRSLMVQVFGDWQGFLSLGNMPTLEDVCVWTIPFPPDGQNNLYYSGSPNIDFNTDCINGMRSNNLTDFSIYPNPFSHIVTFEFETPIQGEIEICNLNGKIIHKQFIQTSSEQVDMTIYNRGIYIVKIRSNKGVSTTKLMKK